MLCSGHTRRTLCDFRTIIAVIRYLLIPTLLAQVQHMPSVHLTESHLSLERLSILQHLEKLATGVSGTFTWLLVLPLLHRMRRETFSRHARRYATQPFTWSLETGISQILETIAAVAPISHIMHINIALHCCQITRISQLGRLEHNVTMFAETSPGRRTVGKCLRQCQTLRHRISACSEKGLTSL